MVTLASYAAFVTAAAILVNGVHSMAPVDVLPYGDGDNKLHGAYVNIKLDKKIRFCGFLLDTFGIFRRGYISSESKKEISPYKNAGGTGGGVFYKQTTEKNTLSFLSKQIGDASFNAAYALLITWHDMEFNGASEKGKMKKNTFQIALVGNAAETETFAIISYVKLDWSTFLASAGADVDTGLGGLINASTKFQTFVGKNSILYYLPCNDKSILYRDIDILMLARTSNTGKPGQMIYRVSTSIQPATIPTPPESADPCAGFKVYTKRVLGEECEWRDCVTGAYCGTVNGRKQCVQRKILGQTCGGYDCLEGLRCVTSRAGFKRDSGSQPLGPPQGQSPGLPQGQSPGLPQVPQQWLPLDQPQGPPSGNNGPPSGNNGPHAGNNGPHSGNIGPPSGNNGPHSGNIGPPVPSKRRKCASLTCPDGFSQYGEQCYKLVKEKKFYSHASLHCIGMDSILAEPKTRGENENIQEIMRDEQISSAWLGGLFMARVLWIWYSDADQILYKGWRTNYPSDAIRSPCMYMVYRKGSADNGWQNGGWRREKFPFICQPRPADLAEADGSSSNQGNVKRMTGSAQRLRQASLVELLIGAILTWTVGRVASGHGQ